MNARIDRAVRRFLVSAFGLLAMTFVLVAFTQTDPSTDSTRQTTTGVVPVQGNADTHSAIAEEMERAKQRNADKAAAYDRYDQDVASAKDRHRAELEKCDSLGEATQKSCKEAADAAFDEAKSKADQTLKSALAKQAP